jgi:hypothetical protein
MKKNTRYPGVMLTVSVKTKGRKTTLLKEGCGYQQNKYNASRQHD